MTALDVPGSVLTVSKKAVAKYNVIIRERLITHVYIFYITVYSKKNLGTVIKKAVGLKVITGKNKN